MNKIERLVYDAIKRNPRLKLRVRNAYQRLLDAVPVKDCESAYPITARKGFFFGFHDKSPWSADGKKLLANRVDLPLRMPLMRDVLPVGYFSGEAFLDFHPISETRAWNWQQGCMLQWIGDTDCFVFNDFEGDSHLAKIYDPSGRLKTTLPVPLAAVSPDGRWGLSYNFERCHVYSPGYGYANGRDAEIDVQKPKKHGLQLVELASGQAKGLFSVADIADLHADDSMDGAYHYLTHCQFAPNSRRFVFFHRWIKDFNVLRTRMISCDLAAKELFIFPTDGMVSHVAWRDSEHVLAYARLQNEGDRYVLFEDRGRSFESVGADEFTSDGHPSYSPDGRWIVTDTYPDRFRVCRLILYDTRANRRYDVAKLRSPRQFAAPRFETNWHCDLHPRWNRSGDMVCFDSAHTGQRALCTIHLPDLSSEPAVRVKLMN
jgi:hypothetical protein